MKIDFRKIELTDLEGNKSTIDVSQKFANAIYQNTGDIGELELAREMYKNGEVELKYANLFVRAIDRLSVINALSQEE